MSVVCSQPKKTKKNTEISVIKQQITSNALFLSLIITSYDRTACRFLFLAFLCC